MLRRAPPSNPETEDLPPVSPTDLREIQRPLKQRYREEPAAAVITTVARAARAASSEPRDCRLQFGPASLEVGAHEGVGGSGRIACSGDVLLAALAACRQITTQMVAAAMGMNLASCEVTVSGDLDLRGTLGMDRDVPVGYRRLACDVRVECPGASAEQLRKLEELSERFCVVHSTLLSPPVVETRFVAEAAPGRSGTASPADAQPTEAAGA
jgi:uncharacterized OsmC-like protein